MVILNDREITDVEDIVFVRNDPYGARFGGRVL